MHVELALPNMVVHTTKGITADKRSELALPKMMEHINKGNATDKRCSSPLQHGGAQRQGKHNKQKVELTLPNMVVQPG